MNYITGQLWLTIDSFIPIRVKSSINRLSDMWLPMPILLFICVSACYIRRWNYNLVQGHIHNHCQKERTRVTFFSNLDFISNFRSEVHVFINSRTSSIHSRNIEQSKCLFNMLLCCNRCSVKKQKKIYALHDI